MLGQTTDCRTARLSVAFLIHASNNNVGGWVVSVAIRSIMRFPSRGNLQGMPKRIFLLADGTGNAAASPFKTNVWRLYQAIDQTRSDQIAFYVDGVGTETFKPLRALGGAFGIGVARNVKDLYQFLCRNYDKGDLIYLFGFAALSLLGVILLHEGDELETRRQIPKRPPPVFRPPLRANISDAIVGFIRKDKILVFLYVWLADTAVPFVLAVVIVVPLGAILLLFYLPKFGRNQRRRYKYGLAVGHGRSTSQLEHD
jgi:hypothetical protein